jgi:sigma-B regulation protein RsbU (phosphoserine phosphatase)
MTVGGDMYDFYTLETGQVLLLAADVAGKWFGAAMGMASLAGMIPLVLEQTGADLTGFVSALNKRVFRWASRVNRFVALIAVVLDPAAHRLRVVNAAFPTGIIRRHDATLENLCADQEAGVPLGVLGESHYREVAFALGPGDAVVIASDGIINATNATGEVYGSSRFNEVLARTEPVAEKLGKAILGSVKSFTGALRVDDDVVMVCFSRGNATGTS